MTVLNFPSSPADGDTFTENDITYTWVENGTNPGFWSASGEQINLQSVTDNGNDTTNEIEIQRDGNGLTNAIEFRNNTNATGTATGIGMEFWLNNSNPQDTGAQINCMENGFDDHAGIQIQTTGPNSANPPVFTEKFRIQPNGQMIVTGFDASTTITSAANAAQVRIHDPGDYNGLPQFVLGCDDELADTETIRYVVVDDLVDQTKSRSASLGVRRNTTIKAGFVNLVTDDNQNGFIWVSNNDIVRTSNSAVNIGTASGGTAVGDQTSDIRVKKHITDYTDGLNKIKQLNPVNFVYTHDEAETVHAGFIAQQVQSIIPESVYDTKEKLPLRDETGEVIRQVPVDEEGVAVVDAEPEVQYEDGPNKLAMSYVEIIPALVNAVKELSAKVQALENEKESN